MSVGFVILAHENLHRTRQLVDYLTAHDCPVAVHIDAHTDEKKVAQFTATFARNENVILAPSIHCEWGCFSLVQATLTCAELLLEKFTDLHHVTLISGSCLPIRPLRQYRNFLSRHQSSDFIESVSLENDKWVQAGLNEERFTLYFPFSWRRHRRLFDWSVELQRKLKIKREIPVHITPHMGSQWWCLSTHTLRAILNDPRRQQHDDYFKKCWIPDESYFQTLARLHSERIESRSLTFAKFDTQGKPFVIYDDHLDLIQKSDSFFVRKIWPKADKLYETLLETKRPNIPMSRAGGSALGQYFEGINKNRLEGGKGCFNAGRYPSGLAGGIGQTVAPYAVYVGLDDLFLQYPKWQNNNTNTVNHGHLFARDSVEFNTGKRYFDGNLTRNIKIRNRNPRGFLMNLLWNQKQHQHSFLFDLRDHQRIRSAFFNDENAHILIVREGWILKFLSAQKQGKDVPSYARRLQEMERAFIHEATRDGVKAQVTIFDLQQALETPDIVLRAAQNLLQPNTAKPLLEMPELISLNGVNRVLRQLKNNGLFIETRPIAQKKIQKKQNKQSATLKLVKK